MTQAVTREQPIREALVDPRLTTLAVLGMCNWAYQWYRPDGPLESGEIAAFFFDLLLNGLRGR